MKNRLLSFFTAFILLAGLVKCQSTGTYIRVSQVGYLKNDIKSGVVLSDKNLGDKNYDIIDINKKSVVLSGKLSESEQKHSNFPYAYKFDFSRLRENGKFFISIEDSKSYTFEIGPKNLFSSVVDTLMQFYKIQRCGYTDPRWHGVCHKADATSIIFNGRPVNKTVDVTGGWHDAADYVKFFNTTAYTTYMLMFAYEFDPVTFGFDRDNNGAPDILEEAKIGLDWLKRADYRDQRFITQVQDLRDHEVGWRMPENDPLEFDRPGYSGIGKNLIGLYSAVMATAARIWEKKFKNIEFAADCLRRAEQKYSIIDEVENIDSSGSGMYIDNTWTGKAALGAVELYNTTGDKSYLETGKRYALAAKSDYWWSWGNINSLAHYQLSKIDTTFIIYIKNNLDFFNSTKNSNLFGEGAAYSWGTNNTLMGISLQVALYKKLTNDNSYDSLAVYQRDYVLGKNQWGISFIHGIGKKYSNHFHHQVAHFMDGELPGGFAAGPVKKEFLEDFDFAYESEDEYAMFQTDSSYYRDDKMDYVSNEPTITANATAIFVMGYYSK